MKKFALSLLRHPLISGSAVLFLGTMIVNVLNLLYSLSMSRVLLSPEDFGTLQSLVSLITLFALAAESLVPTIINFAGIYFAKKDLLSVSRLFRKMIIVIMGAGITILLFFVLFAQDIGRFFNISDSILIMLAGVSILFSFLGVVNRALLQAKLAFGFMAFVTVIGAFSKLIFGITFVTLGFRVVGAMVGFFCAFFVPYFITFIPLRFLLSPLNSKTITLKIRFKDLFHYGGPAALAQFSLTSFITTDMILVKHFFSSTDAGIYAVLSLAGRVIFYFSSPIGMVLFPLLVQKNAKNENYTKDFSFAFLLVFFPSLFLSILYFLFPRMIISVFNTETSVLSYASSVGFFGMFAAIFSLLSVIVNYFLSIQQTKVCIPIAISTCLQVILISFFHQSIMQVIFISLVIAGLLLIGLLLYYFLLARKG